MNGENGTSVKTVTLAELEGLKASSKVGDTYIVSDDRCAVYALLDDADGKTYWYDTNGKSVEEILKLNECYKEGQRKFKENKVSREFLEIMREVLLAISVLGNFFNWSDETVANLINSAIVELALGLYKKDKSFTGTADDLKDSDEFTSYIQMVTMYARTFLGIVQSVRDSAEQAKAETDNLPQ